MALIKKIIFTNIGFVTPSYLCTVKQRETTRKGGVNDMTSSYEPDYEDYNSWEDEEGWGSYEEYGGPNGWDDFTIDAAFDGEPDAVWNID